MPRRIAKLMIGAIVFTAALPATPAISQTAWSGLQAGRGGLMVAPTRLVFEGRGRSAEITLLNTGAAPTTYRISFVRMRMGEDGSFREIDEVRPGELFADPLVRYSPRQVTLEPHVPQTIRLQVRKPADLPPGEYRSHLLLRALPPLGAVSRGDGPSTGIEIQLTAVYGISIPVIVRHGDTWAEARLSDLAVHPDPDTGTMTLGFTIHRHGTRSIYGDVAVQLEWPDGRREVAAPMKGVAVYAPNPVRRVAVQLPSSGSRSARGGRLRVTYSSPDGGEPLAAAEIVLP